MPATTASGWPYVLPGDTAIEFPALSQQLASKLQTEVDRPSNAVYALTANLSIPHNAYTVVSGMSLVIGDASAFTVVSGGLLECNVAGWYQVSAAITFAANATGARIMAINVPTTVGQALAHIVRWIGQGAMPAGNMLISGSGLAKLDVGSQIQFRAHQTSGGALDLLSANQGTSISLARVSRL